MRTMPSSVINHTPWTNFRGRRFSGWRIVEAMLVEQARDLFQSPDVIGHARSSRPLDSV